MLNPRTARADHERDEAEHTPLNFLVAVEPRKASQGGLDNTQPDTTLSYN